MVMMSGIEYNVVEADKKWIQESCKLEHNI